MKLGTYREWRAVAATVAVAVAVGRLERAVDEEDRWHN